MKKFINKLVSMALVVLMITVPCCEMVIAEDISSSEPFFVGTQSLESIQESSDDSVATISVQVSEAIVQTYVGSVKGEVGDLMMFRVTVDVDATIGMEPRTFRVKLDGFDPEIHFSTKFTTPTATGQKIFNDNGIDIYMVIENGEYYLEFTREPGDVKTIGIPFYVNNGVSGTYQSLVLEPSIVDAGPNDRAGEEAKAEWIGTFAWDAVHKEQTNDLQFQRPSGIPSLSGKIVYSISANTKNNSSGNTGDVWTDYVTVTDTLTLPDGVTFPAGAVFQGNKLMLGATTIFEFTNLPANAEVISVTKNSSNQITYQIKMLNQLLRDADAKNDSEMEHVALSAELNAEALVVADDFNSGSDVFINNEVDFVAVPYNADPPIGSDANVKVVIPKADSVIEVTKAAEKLKIVAGESFTYTVHVKNKGAKAETGSVTDTLPIGLMLTDQQKKAFTDADVIWTIDNNVTKITWPQETIQVDGTSTKTFEVTTRANISNDITYFENTACFETQRSNTVTVYYSRTDLTLSKTHTKKDVDVDHFLAGDIVRYQLVVSNIKDVAATNVVITDNLPSYLHFVDADGNPLANGTHQISGYTCKIDGKTLTWDVGTIPGKGSMNIEIPVRIEEIPLTEYWNDKNTRHLYNYARTNDNDAASDTIIVKKPDILLEKWNVTQEGVAVADENKHYQKGDHIWFDLCFTNNETTSIQNLELYDTLPSQLTFYYEGQTHTPEKTMEYIYTDESGAQLTCTLRLSQGAAGETKLTWKFSNEIPANGKVHITTETVVNKEPNADNPIIKNKLTSNKGGEAVESVEIRKPNLKLTKVPSQKEGDAPYKDGEIITYTLSAANIGGVDAENVIFKDKLPYGLHYVYTDDHGEQVEIDPHESGFTGYETTITAIDKAGNSVNVHVKVTVENEETTITWTIVKIGKEEQITFNFDAMVRHNDQREGATIINEWESTTHDYEGDSGEVKVEAPVGDIGKSVDQATMSAGHDTVTYTLTLENVGYAAIKNASLKDILPAGLIMLDQNGNEVVRDMTNVPYQYFLGVNGAKPTVGTPTNASCTVDVDYTSANDVTTIQWSIPKVEPGELVTIILKAKLNAAFKHRPNSILTNWLHYKDKKVNVNVTFEEPNITLTKEHEDKAYRVGDVIKFTIVAKHNGKPAEPLNDLQLTDTLPAGLVFSDEAGNRLQNDDAYSIGYCVRTIESPSSQINATAIGSIHNDDRTPSMILPIGTLEHGYEVEWIVYALVEAVPVDKLNEVKSNTDKKVKDEIKFADTRVDFDKKIIVGKGTDDEKRLDSLSLSEGAEVTYELTFTNNTEKSLAVETGKIIDVLPNPYGAFEYKAPTGTSDDAVITQTGQMSLFDQINIIDKFKFPFEHMTVPAKTTYTHYITVKYPSGARWHAYCEALKRNNVTHVKNTMVYGNEEKSVTHDIVLPENKAKLYIQKGVRHLAGCDSDGVGEAQDKGLSLSHYMDTSCVVYYLSVFNTGESDMTISQVEDVLPPGVTYLGLLTGDEWTTNWGYSHSANYWGKNYVDVNNSNVTFNLITGVTVARESEEPLIFTLKNSEKGLVIPAVTQANGKDVVSGFAFPILCKIDTGLVNPLVNQMKVTVDGAASQGDLDVTSKTSSGGNPNDGNCTNWYDEENDQTTFTSSVTIYPTKAGEIYPGIIKNIKKYSPSGYGNNWYDVTPRTIIKPDDHHEWDVVVSNDGLNPIELDSITDIMDHPYEVFSAILKVEDGETYELDIPTATELMGDDGAVAARSYEFDLLTCAQGHPITLQPGKTATLTVRTKRVDNNYYAGRHLNTAVVKTVSSFAQYSKGEPGADGDIAEDMYNTLTAKDAINVFSGEGMSSWKEVSEYNNASNKASSDQASAAGTNYILVDPAANQVEYKLYLQNVGESTVPTITIIDNLPHSDDKNPVHVTSERGSTFDVQFKTMPAVYVSHMDGTSAKLEVTQYQMYYSIKADGFDQEEYLEADAGEWSSTYFDGARSFRLMSTYPLKQGETLMITFNATLGENAKAGLVAWNNFGYYWNTADEKGNQNKELTSPPRVGVSINQTVMDFAFTKVKKTKDPEGATISLTGAEFTLTPIGSEVPIANISTDPTRFVYEGLAEGKYLLEETKAPSGYLGSGNQWEIEIVKSDEDGTLTAIATQIAPEGGSITLQGEKDAFTLANQKIIELPVTGGMGTHWFTACGLLLSLIAGLMLAWSWRKKRMVV
ncbi:MAG: DUF11 domain-containing protein [Clostridiales bacterium]|nr:DUF11 domain-containing protein [Clostridiales bacterium]